MNALWFDEVEIGEKSVFGNYYFERERMIAFAEKYDPQSHHLNDEAAAASHFGRLSASGWHTSAAYMACHARHMLAAREQAEAEGKLLPPAGPSPGFEDLHWSHPVYAGDTVTYEGEVLTKRELSSKPEWGLVTCRVTGTNQSGVEVFSFTAKVMIGRRQARG